MNMTRTLAASLALAAALGDRAVQAQDTTATQSDAVLGQKLDSIAAANLAQDHAVGAVVAVVKDDHTLLFKSYGLMDAEAGVPMRTDALFGIGSITKQFTAAGILLLRDEGKLSLDDDITKWLPDFDTRGNRVPLRRLLDHTSGIPDVTTMPEFRRLLRDPGLPADAMYELIKRHPFQFGAGTAQIYNNSAYWLLHRVIERASGISYTRYIETKLLTPLGMTRSGFCLSAESVPGRARGHRVRNGAVRRVPLNATKWYLGSGALCSTAGDLVTWLQALHGGKVLTPASYAELIRPATLTDGTTTRYAGGLEVRTDAHGLRFVGHSGEITGYAARANWYPDARMAIVVLMNNSGDASPTAMAQDLAAAVVPVSPGAPKPFTGDAALLAGTYRGLSRDGEMVVTVKQEPKRITVSVNGGSERVAAWIEGLTFRAGSALLTFRRANPNGAVTALGYDAGSGYYVLQRMDAPAALLARTQQLLAGGASVLVLLVGLAAAVAAAAVLRAAP